MSFPEIVPEPNSGRVFRTSRRVRLGDVTGSGRFRLDSMVRFLQDIANDDGRDAQMENLHGWVVRRTAISVDSFPRYLEMMDLSTWCSGTGSHWAERRTTMISESGRRVEAAALWVHVDLDFMRPKVLSGNFHSLVAEATGGRKVASRHSVREKPTDGDSKFLWPMRVTDIDALNHMNNAAYWEAIEELVRANGGMSDRVQIVLEHHDAIEPGESVSIVYRIVDDEILVWHVVDGERVAAATSVRLFGR